MGRIPEVLALMMHSMEASKRHSQCGGCWTTLGPFVMEQFPPSSLELVSMILPILLQTIGKVNVAKYGMDSRGAGTD